ncbi:MAG: hypothetical protein KU29_06540 [Sulfurovum sp. FS06-10]|nr:MAG: hypothetical protein KU29_06540 [Sulfurovum sp. FS06-10]
MLNSTLANATATDALTLTLTDTTLLSVDDLIALDAKTSVNVNAASVDTIEGTVSEVNTLYGINGVSNLGNDTVNVSNSGNFTSSNFSNIVNGDITHLNFADNSDGMSFTNASDFDTWKAKFTSIDFGTSNDDSISFTSSISGNLDFSNISDLETLNLSASGDNLTISGDEPTHINGLGGNDSFVLDFTNIANFTVDAGADTDTLSITVSNGNTLAGNFSNFEVLNLSGTGTISIDDAVINSWSSNADSLSLSFNENSTYNYSTDGGTSWTSGVLTLNDPTSGDHYIVSLDTTYNVNDDLTLHVV